ncbi:uncharacterized protein LY89DRAFT_392848 [Mollisia scopiformis]|uniref:Uncharacterized protein n=1 Tax=Mollisia scopiformis TaxID=149040 RepID=A0A194XP86_MOLSC|nr:uncharacterized protein LY89DRAFT_392848 [Mollisia scopiformis]KUJ22060.1 hypothetical protein LY89DRAFT_392848 [Mollisia scopiformis]
MNVLEAQVDSSLTCVLTKSRTTALPKHKTALENVTSLHLSMPLNLKSSHTPHVRTLPGTIIPSHSSPKQQQKYKVQEMTSTQWLPAPRSPPRDPEALVNAPLRKPASVRADPSPLGLLIGTATGLEILP